MANNQTKSPIVIGAIVMAVATMGAGFFLALSTGGADSPPPVEVRAQAAKVAEPPSVAVPAAPAAATEPSIQPSIQPSVSPDHAPGSKHNRMARDLEREQIWSALGRKHKLEPAAPGSAAPTEKTAAELPPLDPQYIRSAIEEQLVPVAEECFESALADDPKLAGTIFTDFTLIGSEDVGGVVEEAAIRADESTLESEFVRECIRESLMAVTFEPPPDGGRVEVSFTFEFSPED